MQWQPKVSLTPAIIKKVFNVGEGKNQDTVEAVVHKRKQLLYFVDLYSQLPWKPLLKWILTVSNLAAVASVLYDTECADLCRTHSSLWNSHSEAM